MASETELRLTFAPRELRRGQQTPIVGGAPAAAHAAPVPLARDLSGSEALRRIGLACLDQLRCNEPAVLAGAAEGIHQMRVAVRRLRAILAAFARVLPANERRRVSRELRWLARALGPVRNLDVFEEALLRPAAAALEDTGGIAMLAAAAARRRAAAQAVATQAVSSPRYMAMLRRLSCWFESCGWRDDTVAAGLDRPAGTVAAAALDRRLRVARRRGKGFARQSAKDRHRLRIALKKLRYAGDLLAGLYDPAAVARFAKRVKLLQDDLGDANDLRLGRDIVASLAPSPCRDDPTAAAGRRVLRWHKRRLARRERRMREELRRLFAARPFWNA